MSLGAVFTEIHRSLTTLFLIKTSGVRSATKCVMYVM